MTAHSYSLNPIGHIATPFQQKFAIPRQSALTRARGCITLSEAVADPRVFKGIEDYSHLWLLFIFHETLSRGWKPAVKAPRLGGNDTMGVFASRSTHRPNGIGMSVVKNEGWHQQDDQLQLLVSGVDLLDGTPIIDIKPYLAYADAVADAEDKLDSYAPLPERSVRFHDEASLTADTLSQQHPDFRALLCRVLQQDPRPAYRQKLATDPKVYKVVLYHNDISWRVTDGTVEVLSIDPLSE
ncbi:tRNA (N6-threonylcarbamoyladenosine(37)-N6)-methyltransferase TrmO [Alteromonas sp. ASW11-19]|uniref:tRNA (N6-threonylcarbamoyladenosine(37)-N6)-methyltransferase TrmO n=1 Tax=Alteromonas salexigens TaxID=2982530 RepID=A0ABT2VRL2_9ALTE|nr:tRNA (N6-threonylcarbamoyladenosine(37)-N6)-methyltransferase TrmO [Alteromonas salexigens]MCU7555699.1 tRNA (N6-threonylcarbamoyladenosine(37)-N6)-methyltransferase TrmO [Alteromonas salexigens]